MKLTALLIFGALLHVHAEGFAQKITLNEKDAPIQAVLKKIEKQTTFKFLYISENLQGADKVTIKVKDATILEVLDLCFKGTRYVYEINNQLIAVRPKISLTPNEPGNIHLNSPRIIDVKGVIVDENSAPAPGVNVTVKGTKIGTSTNFKGEFTLQGIDENAILLVSSIGYDRQEVAIKGKAFINLQLRIAIGNLDELQVIAYGNTSKRFSTGNVATVKSTEIEKQPVQNPLLALQGRVPGLEVIQTSGLNGGGVSVRIQGRNSITSGLEPLIVIDGVPYPSQFYNSTLETMVQGGSPLNYVNTSDIESIDVLKDADATAIYGSRAANGAILITTKRGKAGRAKFNVNLQQGFGKVTRRVDMMNTRQYLDMRYEAYKNEGISISTLTPNSSNYDLTLWDTTRYTDWQETLIGGTAKYSNINAALSGGTSNLQYLVNGTFNRQTTVFPGDFDNKIYGLHFNLSGSSNNQRLRLQLTASYTYNDNFLPGFDLTGRAVRLEPNAPALYNPNGTLNWAQDISGTSSWENPLAYTLNTEFNNVTKNLIANAVLGYRIFRGLEFKTSFGYTDLRADLYLPSRLEVERPERRPTSQRNAAFGDRSMSSWIVEPQINYESKIANGRLEALLGTTIQKSNNQILSIRASGFASDLLMPSLLAAKTTTISSATSLINRFNALFGRLNYNLKDKYLINVSARRDGSNKFGDENKFHNFWAVGAGWIFSEEKWFQKLAPYVSFGKLRGSYGTTGNDQIQDFSYLSLYTINNPGILYQDNIGLHPYQMPNPRLQWEETRKLQSGIDLGVFSDRVIVSGTYVFNRSSNQLISFIIPEITGFTSITKNLPATVENKGWEFMINTVPIKGPKLSWNSSFNLTISRNKVTSFPGIELTAYANGNQGIIVGQPIGVAKVFNYAGVSPNNGRYVAYDKNKNFTISPSSLNDRVFLQSVSPTWYGGWVNSIKYKGFHLEFLFQFVRKRGLKDMYYYNGSSYPGTFSQSTSNQPISVLNRWQKPGDNGPIARYSTNNLGTGNVTSSDIYYSFQASYARLKNLSLSWSLPSNWLQRIKVKNVLLYFRGQNIATVTNFTGLDPETMSSSVLPPLQMWTVGTQIDL